MFRANSISCAFALFAVALPFDAAATFSISACDADGACGVAVATNNLAVGATVPYAAARTGAVATQFETNPSYGPKALKMLERGESPRRVMALLLAGDGNFEGLGTEYRQVAIVAATGGTAAHSGRRALEATWSGAREARGVVILGNGLENEGVLEAMDRAYRSATGELAARLLAALEAGQAAGGQKIGGMSAALLVRTVAGGFADTDLRVDASREPVRELRRIFDLRRAHAMMLRAESAANAGRKAAALADMEAALALGGEWDRIVRRALRLAIQCREFGRARRLMARFRALNPAWAMAESEDPFYASVDADQPTHQ
jgi:uncharacterized Ntn-hydrolase superfamily protein